LAEIFVTLLAIEWLFKFLSYLMSAPTLPGKNRPSKSCVELNEKNFNKFHLSRSLGPNNQSITRFDYHKAVCLLGDVQECL